MIDTIKVAYPVFPELVNLIEANMSRLVKLSPSGEVEWEKAWCHIELPSHYDGLRVTLLDGKGLRNQGFTNAKSLVMFEFSLQKWQSETGYNNRNTSIYDDLQAFNCWIAELDDVLCYKFEKDLFELYRVDLSQNYLLMGETSIEEYLRALHVKFSRHPNGENVTKYKGSIHYGSSWISKKMYSKWQEFQDVERKKKKNVYTDQYLHNERKLYILNDQGDRELIKNNDVSIMPNGKRALSPEEVMEMLRMMRFEMGFKRTYLQKHEILKVNDIPVLLGKYEEDKLRYMTVQKLGTGLRLSPAEYYVVDLCKRYGVNGAKAEYLKTRKERSWYMIKRSLIQKGVYIEAILREDWLTEISEVDNLCDFELRLAA